MRKLLSATAALLLLVSLAACGGRTSVASPKGSVSPESESSASSSAGGNAAPSSDSAREEPVPTEELLIQLEAGDGVAVRFRLNTSTAAEALYQQLPLTVRLEDFAGSEKIFYLPESLDPGDAPLARGPAGTLAYYGPWGNVAVFYAECGGATGLYELGEAVTGTELLSSLTGEVRIAKAVDET